MVEDPPEGTDLGTSDLAEQAELVKLTPVPMGLEELHNLWFGFFQAPYFLSMVYQASVVLIEGKKKPLPKPAGVKEPVIRVDPFQPRER
jgi:hypothetical protein